jgi:2-keto-4-pentenoate hydratase
LISLYPFSFSGQRCAVQLNQQQINDAADALYAAEVEVHQLSPTSERYPTADIEDAYAISQGVTARKVAAGRVIKGHKIGLTSKAMRSMASAKEPDYGTLTDDFFVLEGSTISPARLQRALVEVEIAFVLKSDLRGPAITAVDVIRATDFVLPCLEIVDSRHNGRGPNPLVDTIADAASCGMVVLGSNPRRLDQIDIRRIGAVLLKNGEVEESGTATAIMGNPVNAVVWLANKLHEFGVPLLAGHVLLSGSFVKAIPFGAGDTLSAIFDTLGEVNLAVAKE